MLVACTPLCAGWFLRVVFLAAMVASYSGAAHAQQSAPLPQGAGENRRSATRVRPGLKRAPALRNSCDGPSARGRSGSYGVSNGTSVSRLQVQWGTGSAHPQLNGKFERSGRTDKDELSQLFTGKPDMCFLLTNDGRVGYDEPSNGVRMTRVDGTPLDLLVLSECEAAVGNDRAGLRLPSPLRAPARIALPVNPGRSRMRQAGEWMIDRYSPDPPSLYQQGGSVAKGPNHASKQRAIRGPLPSSAPSRWSIIGCRACSASRLREQLSMHKGSRG